ncbi:DNA translocase FtsK [Halalkalibacter alkaliphilus]|uniref:DNA translocase FtsK n=1 Tax=Halalkalibacter alkaliphilus TaxID=2917993 RepID=A0A9X2CT81_9BACI|nr:DNA translocase FtsK [Halalkalibacter alkaliphilus]MCL7747840.1 DNA translocase FtsK [Halalkalibacter alkaliphilus]
MGTLHRWMRRLQQFLSGEPTEEKEIEARQHRTETTYKSFQVENKKSESKVVYQYPKKGNFRFPLIDDKPKAKVSESKNRKPKFDNRSSNPTMKKAKQVEKVDPTWNSNSKSEFKLSEIPSPVYGFKARESAKSRLGDTLSVLPFEDKSKKEAKPHNVEQIEKRIEKNVTESLQSEIKPKIEQKNPVEQIQISSEEVIKERKGSENELEVVQDVKGLTDELELGSTEVKGRPYNVPTVLEEALARATSQQEEERKEQENVTFVTVVEELEEKIEEISEVNVKETVEEIKEEFEEINEAEIELEESIDVAQSEEEVELTEVAQPEEAELTEVEEPVEEAELTEVEEPVEEPVEEAELTEVKQVEGKVEENYIEPEASEFEGNQESFLKTVEESPKQKTGEVEMSSVESMKPKKEEQDHKTSEVSKPQKAAIPFNVMMLPQDRKRKQSQVSAPTPEKSPIDYSYPSIQLLNYPELQEKDESEWLKEQGTILEETLQSFHVDAKVVHVTKGPSVTRFEIQPGRGVKVTKITGLTDDMKLALAAKDIRIEAPIPGKNTIGIEVPNRTSTPVFLREILRRKNFIRSESPLTVALGLDISGQPIVTDLKKMPHGLVAGATGSGKSVCINSVLVSLLFKATPDEVKLMLIDPKMVELAPYNGLPHLVTPVITDAKQATAALKWVVLEMERRYELFSQQGVRDVGRYNEIYSESPDKPALPFILVVIDELADLMMVSPQEVEDSICRIAQKARACGIHLLLATQRPSVDVITGLIKANIPTRIAFSVSSQTDSRTILDMGGAERLLGKGDMLFHENGSPKPVRVQGTFVSDEEIEDVVAHVKKQREPEYLLQTEQLKHVAHEVVDDEHFEEACYFVIDQGSASASSLQRRFRVGYNRAARLIDMMEERGIVSEAKGSKPRHVLVDELELEEVLYHKEG